MRNQIAEAQKIASGGGSQQDIAEANIELEVNKLRSRAIARNLELTHFRSWRAYKLL